MLLTNWFIILHCFGSCWWICLECYDNYFMQL